MTILQNLGFCSVHVFSEVSSAYAKTGLLGILSNKCPNVEYKEIRMDESGKLLL